MHVLDQASNIAGRAVFSRAGCPSGRFTKLYLRDIGRKTPVFTVPLAGTMPAATIGVQDG